MMIQHQINPSRIAFPSTARAPRHKAWLSTDPSRDSDTERATMTDSSPYTRRSLLPALARGPSLVSDTVATRYRRWISLSIPTWASFSFLIHLTPNFVSPVALALREQVMAAGQVPVGTSDVMVDMIVTPDETIAADGDASR
jgi:hypothetical protein